MSEKLVQELIRATKQERERIEDPRNRSRYFIFGKISEDASAGVYKVVFSNAPERVIRDAERGNGEAVRALFKIGDSFVEGTMGLGKDRILLVAIPGQFLREQNIDTSVLSGYTDTGIDYVMDNRDLVEYVIEFLEKWGNRENLILPELLQKEKKVSTFTHINHTHSLQGLNPSQQDAVEKMLEQRITFVWGPPGTGKTKTLGALAAALVSANKRVLLCALSNSAVDQLFLGAAARVNTKDTAIARLGKNIDKRSLPFSKEAFQEGWFLGGKAGISWKDHLQKSSIVGANFTYLSLPRLPWLGKFDYVIADEVSMANIPSLAVASFFAQTSMVLGGDPYQLPPIFPEDAEEPNIWFKESIFAHAGVGNVGERDPRMAFLDTQYRMHPDIGDLVSTLFYDGKLKSNNNPATAVSRWSERKVIFIDTVGEVKIIQERSFAKDEQRRINDPHVFTIIEEVLYLLSRGVLPRDIGIIAPYNAQVANIAMHLKRRGISNELQVSTVHSFQGQERRVVLVDFTDDDSEPTHLTAKWQLINVALSRARELLILVGNKKYLQNDKYFSTNEIAMFNRMLKGFHIVEATNKK